MEKFFDIVIIGSGPGGYVAAIRASQLGFSVAIVEREELGGVCLNWGCIPTKALLHYAEIIRLIKHSNECGITTGNIIPNLGAMIDQSRRVAAKLSNGIKNLMKKHNIEVLNGEGKLLNEQNILVKQFKSEDNITQTIIKAKNIIIATGARAIRLDHIPIDHKNILNYKDALALREIPKNLLIIGGGVMGVEFATLYSALGSCVTIVEAMPRILMNEDQEIVNILEKDFINSGIKILTNMEVISINSDDPFNIMATIRNSQDGKNIKLHFDKALSLVGLVPNTEDIGLENTAVKCDKKGFIIVNDDFSTNQPNIYAIGDVIGAPMLAHKASHEGVICVEKIAGICSHETKVSKNSIPSCIYSTPQIASVGLSEEKAKELGISVKVGRFSGIANGKAVAIGEEKNSMVKLIFDTKTGELIGAHMVGSNVTEMIYGLNLLKKIEGTEEDIIQTIFPHPTLSEMIHEASLAANERTLHI